MRFEHERLQLTLHFDPEDAVSDLAIRTLIAKAEAAGYWNAVAVVPPGTRLDVFDNWYEEASTAEGMATYRLALGLRARTLTADEPAPAVKCRRS